MPPFDRTPRDREIQARIAQTGRAPGPAGSALLPGQTRGGEQIQELNRQLSGQRSRLRTTTGRLLSGEEIFQERDPGVDRSLFGGITDLLLTTEQQRQLSNLSRTAASRGLRGGAVQGQLTSVAQQQLATNRAQGFRNVTQAGEAGVNRLQGRIAPFLQQIGRLQNAFASGDQTLDILSQGAGDRGRQQQFASPLIEALTSVGQGRAVTAGLLLQENADISQFGLSGQELQVARAVSQFVNPQVSPEQQRAIGERFSGVRAQGERRGALLRAQEFTERASSRVQAGEFLGNVVQQPLRDFRAAVDRFRGSQVPVASFLAGRFAGGAQQIAQIDTSQFDQAFNRLSGGFELQGTPAFQRRDLLSEFRRRGFV